MISYSKNKYSLDESFIFDDLKIILGSNISYTTVPNHYSGLNWKTIVKMPIIVKNFKDKKIVNMFYFKILSLQGTKFDSVSSYFDDDCVNYASNLRTNGSYTKYFYFLYDWNGKYVMKFDDWSNKITVEFDINK